MYQCTACGRTTQPGQPRRTHVVQRTVPAGVFTAGDGRTVERWRREIARELPVCHPCDRRLAKQGLSWADLLAVLRTEAGGGPGFSADGPPPPPPPPAPRPAAPKLRAGPWRKPVTLGRAARAVPATTP